MRTPYFNAYPVIVFILMGLFASGCGKKKGLSPTDSYIVSNVGEVSVHQGGSTVVTYEIKLVSGSQKEVRLGVSDLPSGVSVDLSPASGFAPYTCTATFSAVEDIDTGTYPFVVKAISDGLEETFNTNLIVKREQECISNYFGEMSVVEQRESGQYIYKVTCSVVPETTNRLLLENFYDWNYEVYADFNCATQTINIPAQAFVNAGIQGTGIFTSSGFEITYKIYIFGIGSSTYTARFIK